MKIISKLYFKSCGWMLRHQFYLLTWLLLVNYTCQSQNTYNTLTINWKFRQFGTSNWYSKNVKGNVHLDLHANGLIKEPFFSDNEKELQWIENEDWEYEGDFILSAVEQKHKHIEICFSGLDTYASVFLNDSLVLNANNMFRAWTIDIKKLIKPENNRLRIVFKSAVKSGKREASKLNYALPEGERVFTRKAQYHYGWDWGPRFVTSGICEAISINAWTGARILSLGHEIKQLNNSRALVNVTFQIECDSAGRYDLNCESENEKFLIMGSQYVFLKKGLNRVTIPCTTNKPRLWWCNGLGEQYIYKLFCELRHEGKLLHTKVIPVGLRTIELVTEPDKAGRTFYFKLNGKMVFVKGANYIPVTPFIIKDKDSLNMVLKAKEAGMNMLRVWGGGVYGTDQFYSACDSLGIMVWQDFMFACAMYPGDSAFVNNVKEEVRQQVARLRNHPSLALWCGNNENDEGWKNWGWQKQLNYSKNDSASIWGNYLNLFHKQIPGVLKESGENRAYWPSSPLIGWGHHQSLLSGDSHYWGVWWGMQPFSVYAQKVGRFMSEYGFQSLPDYKEFETFCGPSQMNLNSSAVKSHQKHKAGFETIDTYLRRDYNAPKNFREYIYVSQLLQRDGMKTAIESHRSAKPYCMGTLFWQFNDCWPVVSWSAYSYTSPKAFYYSLKKLYATVLINVTKVAQDVKVNVVSDSLKNIKAEIKMKLMDFKGNTLWFKDQKIKLTNKKGFELKIPIVNLPNFDSTKTFFRVELTSEMKLLATNNLFFTSPKNRQFPKTEISITGNSTEGFVLSSPFFAKDVFLYNDSNLTIFNDNYFDLMPGEVRKIKLLGPLKDLSNTKLNYLVLNNLN